MPQEVQRFVDEWRPALEREIARFLATPEHPELACDLVNKILERWSNIAIADRQIAYVENEREFWFGLHSLRILCQPRPHPLGAVERAEFERALCLSAELLASRGKLPERLNARRPLP
jgi:hypothetical protein